MRLAVIADSHGNPLALQAVLPTCAPPHPTWSWFIPAPAGNTERAFGLGTSAPSEVVSFVSKQLEPKAA